MSEGIELVVCSSTTEIIYGQLKKKGHGEAIMPTCVGEQWNRHVTPIGIQLLVFKQYIYVYDI